MKKIYFTLIALSISYFVTAQGTPTGSSTEVGVTDGQLSVSLTGSANYSIPIALPAGINGISPQISLTYNSQGANGLAGYGWNISGVSAITRIPSTKYHDTTIDPVDFDAMDRFAFDGQRLLLKSGTYGASGSVYETENFSNIRITAYGVNPSGTNFGPAYFFVEYPDGSKAYYGNSTDSCSIMDWGITYWENPQGMRITYNYTLSNNSLSIASITYGGIGTATVVNKIQFLYKARQRPEQMYIGGQSIIRSTILNEINVISNRVGFRNYILEPEVTSLGYERLKSITEKSGDYSKSYNPTVFSYDTTNNSTLFNLQSSTTLPYSGIDATNTGTVSGDFDGDGQIDIITYPISGTDAKKKFRLFTRLTAGGYNNGAELLANFDEIVSVSFLNTSNKLMPREGWTVIKTDATTNLTSFKTYTAGSSSPISYQNERSYQFPALKYSDISSDCNKETFYSINLPKKYLSGDFNGDGITDVLAIEKSQFISYHTRPCIPNNIVNQNYIGKAFLINLDPRVSSNFVTPVGTVSMSNFDTAKLYTGDFNGDGKSDVYLIEAGKASIYTLNESNSFVLLTSCSEVGIKMDKPILMGDYNGDGKIDFAIPQADNTDSWNFYFSKGTAIYAINQAIGLPYYGYKYGFYGIKGFDINTYSLSETSFIANDYNGDGKTDILFQENLTVERIGNNYSQRGTPQLTSLSLFENKGFSGTNVSFYKAQSRINIARIRRNPIPIFTNHNKVNQNLDYSLISDNAIQSFTSPKDNKVDILMNKITTGNGVTQTITYKPLKQDQYEPVYSSSDYIENYPNFDIVLASGFKVVRQLEKQSASVYKKQQFSYYGAVSNLEGLGFLGFRSISSTNWFNKSEDIISSVSKYDISLRGANTENYTVPYYASLTSNTLPSNYISRSVLLYNSLSDALLSNKVFKLKNTGTQQYNTLENTGSESTPIYDAYNNPTQVIVKLKNGASVEQTTLSTVVYDNQPTGTPYYIGRPTSKTQNVTVTGDVMSSEELYIYTNHLLTQIKKKGNNTDYITEDNQYDSFGNITQKTITASGLPPRVTSYQYDPSGRFLTKSTDIEGLTTSFFYNTNNGVLDYETNPYGLTTRYYYDAWFKKIKTTDYLGKNNNYTYSRNGGESALITTGDDGSVTREVFDDLGRTIVKSTKIINGTYSYIYYNYDIYDRVIGTSEPYTSTASLWNTTAYDIHGRIKQSISAKGKTITMGYQGLTTTVDDGNQTKTYIKNSIGNVVAMTDNGGTINYTYFANGNLKSSNYDGVITSIEQDGWGRKTKLIDSSAGTYTYKYNGFGETVRETAPSPNGTTTYTLNTFGKITQKTIVGDYINSITDYTYDNSSKLLTDSKFTDVLEKNLITTTNYVYDSYKRLLKTTETTPYATFTKELSYDGFGRPETRTSTAFSSGKTSARTTKTTYKNGEAWQIIDNTTQQVLWQTDAVNARGQLTNATLGNGIAITNTFDQYGFASQFKHDKTGTNAVNVMTLNTVFDPKKDNLTSRSISLFSWNESFKYDSLDRLTTFTNQLSQEEVQTYDNRGRITQNNLGTYVYTYSGKPYQNSSINLNPLALPYYQGRPTLNITYNAFKSPVQIEDAGKDNISFTYNDNNDRSTMYYGSLDVDKLKRPNRKYYSADGTMEIKHNIASGVLEFVTYIGGDGYSAPIVLKSDGGTQNYLYLHRDYQGSIVAITDATGAVVEKRLFDAWGGIVKVQNGYGVPLAGLTVLDRGYTGHEHLQSVGIINMNGRIYDPKLHRFLQPDNYVQEPFNTQNFNRYGYCWNNPTKFSDPSGEWIWIVAAAVIGGVVNWAVHGAQFNMEGLKAFGIGAAAGTIGALTGGAAFAAAGGAAAGAGGILAGAAGGAVGAAYSQVFLSVGNNIAFGDPLMSGKDMIKGIAFGAVVGGVFNGVAAFRNDRTLLRGAIINPKVSPISIPEPAGLVKTADNAQIKADVKIANTTQTSTSPTTQANTATAINRELGVVDVSKNPSFRIVDDGTKSFFDNTQYTDKVISQMKTGDFHSFPRSVEAFELNGTVSPLKGGDGIYRQILKIPGQYGNRSGFFEFIKEADGMINHRLFNIKP